MSRAWWSPERSNVSPSAVLTSKLLTAQGVSRRKGASHGMSWDAWDVRRRRTLRMAARIRRTGGTAWGNADRTHRKRPVRRLQP